MKRVHGPYLKGKKLRLVIIDCATGAQTYESFATNEEAEARLKVLKRAAIREAIQENGIKVGDAIDQYATHRKEAGKRAGSIETTTHRLRALFRSALLLLCCLS